MDYIGLINQLGLFGRCAIFYRDVGWLSMARLLDISIFKRNRAFALLYSGQFVSFVGTMMSMVALPFQIYTATHSTVMVGLLSLVHFQKSF